MCVSVSCQGPRKCEYGCGALPNRAQELGGKEEEGGEEKRKTERNEEEEEAEEEREKNSILCSSLMKGGIGSSSPTPAFSLGDEP